MYSSTMIMVPGTYVHTSGTMVLPYGHIAILQYCNSMARLCTSTIGTGMLESTITAPPPSPQMLRPRRGALRDGHHTVELGAQSLRSPPFLMSAGGAPPMVVVVGGVSNVRRRGRLAFLDVTLTDSPCSGEVVQLVVQASELRPGLTAGACVEASGTWEDGERDAQGLGRSLAVRVLTLVSAGTSAAVAAVPEIERCSMPAKPARGRGVGARQTRPKLSSVACGACGACAKEDCAWCLARLQRREKSRLRAKLVSEADVALLVDPDDPFAAAGAKKKSSRRSTEALFAQWIVDTFGGLAHLRGSGGVGDIAGGKGVLAHELFVLRGVPTTTIDPRPVLLQPDQRRHRKRLAKAVKKAALNKAEAWDGGGAVGSSHGDRDDHAAAELVEEHLRSLAWARNTYAREGRTGQWEAPSQRAEADHHRDLQREQRHHHDDRQQTAVAMATTATTATGFVHVQAEFWGRPECSERVKGCEVLVGLHSDQATEAVVDTAIALGKPWAVVPCCVFPSLFADRVVEGRPVRSYDDFVAYLLTKLAPGAVRVDFLPCKGRNKILFSTHGSTAANNGGGGSQRRDATAAQQAATGAAGTAAPPAPPAPARAAAAPPAPPPAPPAPPPAPSGGGGGGGGGVRDEAAPAKRSRVGRADLGTSGAAASATARGSEAAGREVAGSESVALPTTLQLPAY
jgi:hypothetical protein